MHRAPNPNSLRSVTNLLAYQLALRGHISEAWTMALSTKNYLAGEIAGLGLIPTDSALKILRPWLGERSDASIAPLPVLALARDSAALLSMAGGIEKAMQADTSSRQRAVMGYIASSARAYAALARGDTVAATRLFDALPDTVLTLPFDVFIRARLIGKQDPKRAIALLERHNSAADILYPARELERGRLAERTGDRDRAVDAYAYVAAVWQNADPGPLRDGAKEATDALKRLDSDGKLRAQLGSVSKR
jgi:hypothetical protein